MDLVFTDIAWKEFQYWQERDKKVSKRIHALITDTMRTPFEGIGKPEPLKHSLAGCWSRRINTEHRLVYKLKNDQLIILQCRYHYSR